MIHFTADSHFGHANIIRHCSRPFASVGEMDAAIMDAINAKVGRGDTLWVLGDFSFRGRDPSHYLERLNCRDVRLLCGNHDKRSKCRCFRSVADVAEISVGKQRIWLSHYPHRSWPASHRGSWHLYGHTHGSLDADDTARETPALDVGVDNCGRYGLAFGEPWSMDDLSKTLPRGRRAATVVELLVVLAIIASLCGLLVPAFVAAGGRRDAELEPPATIQMVTVQHDGHWWVLCRENFTHHPDCPCRR